MSSDAMKQAREELAALVEAARTGAIIPVRLPGQLEAVAELLVQAETDQEEALAAMKKAQPAGDAATVMSENAEFLKTAVHELRTPMTSIRGYADMLANPAMAGELNDMQNQLLKVIRSNSRRMEGLLSDMSTMNKLRAGILTVNPKMDMFKNIAMMIEKETRPIADELNRQLVFETPQGLPLLNVDGEHLTAAAVKLIENGLRYSAEGEGKVTVTSRADGSTLVVEIRDNGIGISEDEIARLGELFFRADHDMVRAYKGSGLGIPIAYGLLDALGGKVAVESTPGEGSCFTISLPGMT